MLDAYDAQKSDPAYYHEKIADLVQWLRGEEACWDNIAEQALDAGERHEAAKAMATSNAAKRARMWIRNHVLLPVDHPAAKV